jgi:hypothetical protein
MAAREAAETDDEAGEADRTAADRAATIEVDETIEEPAPTSDAAEPVPPEDGDVR